MRTTKGSLAAILFSFFSFSCQQNEPIVVNFGSTHEYARSQSDGEKDLEKQIIDFDLEDSWLYHKNRWYDVGYLEDRRSANINSSVVPKMISGKIKEGDLIYTYHIHTQKHDLACSPPSGQDLQSYVLMKWYFHDNYRAILKARVSDDMGVWEYDISSIMEQLIISGEAPSVNQAMYELLLDVSAKDKPRKEKIQEYIDRMDDFGVFLSYRSDKFGYLEHKLGD